MNFTEKWKAVLAFLTLGALFPAFTLAQSLSQTVRGRVVDTDSKMGISNATLVVIGSDPVLGALSDSEGYFRIDRVPVGRIDLLIRRLGYDEKAMPDLLIVSGKETVLEIELRESFTTLNEVVIVASEDKSKNANEMSLVSARSFTVEETKRYAGAINDPARMVASYAGVNSDGSGNNDIIVRGNNSQNIQWRLEGVEIPNPNHFAQEGLTGGPISALNSQMLSNSSFYTGAFAPEFGNALAGIFDMKLRKGNNEKREYTFSVGVLGTDLTLEGPISKRQKSSYLINYRYSTLALLDRLRVVDFNGVPTYQDLSFKVFIPTQKLGTFSLFGLGGNSQLDLEYFDEENTSLLQETYLQKSRLAIGGLNHFLPVNDKLYFQSTVSYSLNGSGQQASRPQGPETFKEYLQTDLENQALRLASTANLKLSRKQQIQAGVIFTRFNFDLSGRYFDDRVQAYINNQNNEGNASLAQGFVSWKWRISERLSVVNGIHFQKTSQNQRVSIEPRAALRWELGNGQALTGGFGVHSKMTALPNYFTLVNDASGTPGMPNRDLDLSKAAHFVIGYEYKLAPNLFLRAEAYYQYLYQIPIDPNPASSYSLLNLNEAFTDRALVNEGEGRNLGLEVTLERYFHNNYYFLITGSLYDSRYVAADGVWRNTRFNGQYLGNVLFGKEFILNKNKGGNQVLGLNARTALLGGRRLLPVDLDASVAAGRAVYLESEAFEQKNDDIFTVNFSVLYRLNSRKMSHEVKFDVQNLTAKKAVVDQYFDPASGKMLNINQLATFPVLSYNLSF